MLRAVMPIVAFAGVCLLVWTLRERIIRESPRRWKFIVWTMAIAGVLVAFVTIGEIVVWSNA